MLTDSQKLELLASVESILTNYSQIALGEQLRPCDALFAFRILLGRMPSGSQEIDNLFLATTYRQFLTNLLESREFSGQFGFMPGGHRLMTNANGFRFWFSSTDREMGALMATARYEGDTVRLLRKLIKPGMSCVDIGAQTGFFTCLLSSLVGQDGFVWAFEPLPASLELLHANIQENAFASRVQIFPIACSEVSGLLSADVASGMVVASANGTHDFKSTAIDDVLQRRIDFCKIDVEGHEPGVVKGMHRLLTSCQPILLTEFNRFWLEKAGSSISEYANLLQSYRYDLWIVARELTPFDERMFDDVLATMNVLALPQGSTIS